MLEKLHQIVLGFADNQAAKKKLRQRSTAARPNIAASSFGPAATAGPMPWWEIDCCWPIAWTC